MADERLRLYIGKPKRYNENLPGNQTFTRQHLELLSEDKSIGGSAVVAEADAYLDPDKYWAAYWFTHTSPGALIELTEKALGNFERQFPDGVATVDKKTRTVSTPKAVELLWRVAAIAQLDIDIHPRDEDRSGIILHTSEKPNDRGQRLTFPLQRPLSWERFKRLSHQRPISLARVNTRVGAFCITREDDTNLFGLITDLAETTSIATLLELTAEEGVTHEEAVKFLAAVTGLFAAGVAVAGAEEVGNRR